jgi:hypothetical protein
MSKQGAKRYVFTSLAGIMLVACIGDPYLSSYTTNKPNEGDLIGIWVPDKDTVKDMHDRGGYPTEKAKTSLTLKPDGTFEMVDMPDWWREPFGTSHGRLTAYDRGTWRLKEHSPGGRWEIGLDFPSFGSTAISLRRNKPPYIIHFILGDPDSGNAMTFVKEDASN